jgi:hypothetical protein
VGAEDRVADAALDVGIHHRPQQRVASSKPDLSPLQSTRLDPATVMAAALAFCQGLMDWRRASLVPPGGRRWELFPEEAVRLEERDHNCSTPGDLTVGQAVSVSTYMTLVGASR